MNISELALAAQVSTDTLRYYEKQGLIAAPQRQQNGYRLYTLAQLDHVRFIRGAQSLGFSLAEIREILPQLAEGKFGRAQIETQLAAKMAQIDAHINQLKGLKKELARTFSSLKCSPDLPVSTLDGTPADISRGPDAVLVKKSFTGLK
jgi:MerR family copper efflux transcriptional regulator